MQCLGMAIFAESLAMITRVERPLESDISAGYPWGNQVAAVGRLPSFLLKTGLLQISPRPYAHCATVSLSGRFVS